MSMPTSAGQAGGKVDQPGHSQTRGELLKGLSDQRIRARLLARQVAQWTSQDTAKPEVSYLRGFHTKLELPEICIIGKARVSRTLATCFHIFKFDLEFLKKKFKAIRGSSQKSIFMNILLIRLP
jgi:hypothetical protein